MTSHTDSEPGATGAATTATRDPESVYRVIQLVGTSGDSWEDAASVAIAEAAKTIGDLRVAQVVEIDTTVADGAVLHYRIRLKVSYRIDRFRRTTTGAVQVVRRVLVVANQTAGGAALTDVIRTHLEAAPTEFHVLVPATLSRDYVSARRLSTLGVDPLSGYTFGDLTPLTATDEEGLRGAQERLDEQLRMLIDAGVPRPTGEVGDPDPLAAIASVLTRGSFDEIIVSTLPSHLSRWVKLDLPSRVERRFRLPVTHVESAG